MKATFPFLLALPLWLASCSAGSDLIGTYYVESDEFYLEGGERHTGDAAIDEARAQLWTDEYGDYGDGDYDDPYAARMGPGSTQSRLWNRYTPGWSNGLGMNAGFGGYNPYSPFNSGFGGTYGYNNMAFMNGYDAWGNPIGGFGNPGWGYGNPYGNYGFGGNGWGYDPFGGGYWGQPGFGYGYNPWYGSNGYYGNNPWGGFCGTGGVANGGVGTFVPPSPRPNLGQFNGGLSNGQPGGSQGGSNPGATGVEAKPASGRAAARTQSAPLNRGALPMPEPDREPNYGRQSPTENTAPNRTRYDRGNQQQNNWSAPASPRNDFSPSPPRGGSSSPAAPRSGGSRPSSGRSGRGG